MVPTSLLYYLILTPIVLPVVLIVSVNGDPSGGSNSIPRSQNRVFHSPTRYPPWNPSPHIDDDGFLHKRYARVPGEWEKEIKIRRRRNQAPLEWPVVIRQVPGDGNCLFHSISACYAHAVNGTHLDMKNDVENLKWLYQNSAKLRQQAVDCLEQKRKTLFLQDQEYLRSQDLVDAAASQYSISGKEYCRLMRQDSYWGGGPEIVALCNVLQRPIHVYELFVDDEVDESDPNDDNNNNSNNKRKHNKHIEKKFVLRRMACFGSPKFDKQSALHILSADSRFPDIRPGEQAESGNHFMAMFPEEQERTSGNKKKKKRRIRGGDNTPPPANE